MVRGDHLSELKHHMFRIRFTELNQIHIFNSLRSMAFTFIVIFIPIYLFKQGYNAAAVFSYYLSFYLIEAAVEFLTARIIRFYGPKHSIVASVPFFMVHFWMLKTLGSNHWPLVWVAATGAIGVGLFWQAYHYDFSKVKTRGKAASDVSRQYIMIYALAILAPFIGGFLSDNFGEGVVFGLVMILLALATITLFQTSDKHPRQRKIDLSRIKWHCVRKDMLSYSGKGFEVIASMIVWPLFIYFIVGDYKSVGAVVSVSLLIATIITYFVGKKSDNDPISKKGYIKYGGALTGIIYCLQTLVTSTIGVYVSHIARTIVGSVTNAPWDSEYYLHADEESRSEYILMMEVVVDLARALMAAILMTLSIFLPIEIVLVLGLILGGIGAFVSGVMPLARCENCLPAPKKIKVMPRPKSVAGARS